MHRTSSVVFILVLLCLSHIMIVYSFQKHNFLQRSRANAMIKSSAAATTMMQVVASPEFAPIFNPSIAFVSIGIIGSFSYLQLKITQNINLRRQVTKLKEELKSLKLKQLSGESDLNDKQMLISQIEELEAESNAVLRFGSIQFRLPSTIDEDNNIINTDGIQNDFKSSTTSGRGDTKTNRSAVEESVAFDKQFLRILASVLVVMGLSYLLVLLSNDPIA